MTIQSVLCCCLAAAALLPVTGARAQDPVRAQLDTVGFAVTADDMAAVTRTALAAEGLKAGPAGPAWVAAIIPHDDYVYAGRTAVHALAGLRAKRWVVFGVCHACRRLGVRDKLLFDGFGSWRIGGETVPVAADLRAELLTALGPDRAVVDDERQKAEHSVEALVPWLRQAVPDAEFVSVLVPGMSLDRMRTLADVTAAALSDICRREGWTPGVDVGVLISADAVHYGCDGWGDHPYDAFGCDEAGHAAAVAQDRTLAQATLCGPLDDAGPADFARLVWDESDPTYPYRITWCGLYSIPFGLMTARRLQADLGLPPLTGELLRYGDSVSDGRLDVPGTRLGVTAPNTLRHWVGYAAIGYAEAAPGTGDER